MDIYDLWHEYYDEKEECDIYIHIAVYSSKEKVEKAIERLKKLPKFKDHPDDFIYECYTVDEEGSWKEGFVPN